MGLSNSGPRRCNQLHQIQRHQTLHEARTAVQAGSAYPEAMEAEDAEPATGSQVPAAAAPVRPFVTGDDETMEQEEPEIKRQRTVAGLPVCSLLLPVDEIPVSYVATHEIDERPVYDHKTGERLAPHMVNVDGRTECEAMIRHQLFERVLIALARGKKVRCQWLDEMKEGADGPLVRSRLVAMEVARGIRFDTAAGTAPLKGIKIIISRGASIKNERGPHSCARPVRHQRCVWARAAT